MKRHLASLALVAAFLGTLALGAGGASAEHDTKHLAGARALVDAIVRRVTSGEIRITDSRVQVALVNLDRSFRGMRELNRVLDTSPRLREHGIDVVDTVGIGAINEFTLTDAQVGILQTVLTDAQIASIEGYLRFHAHHNPSMDLTDVVVAVLSSGDLVLVARCGPGSDWVGCTG